MVRTSRNWPTLENLEPRVLLSAAPTPLRATPPDDYGNTIATAYSVPLNSAGAASINGVINASRDVDMFKVVASRTGTITVDQRKATGSGLDSYLYIYAPNGTLLGANDDSNGTLNSHVTFSVVAGQTYYIAAAGYGASTGAYTLSIAAAAPVPADDYGNTIGTAYSVPLNSAGAAAVNGVIGAAGDTDMFKVVSSATGTITVDQRAATASALDSYLYIYAPNGTLLGANDDSNGTLNSHVTFSVAAGQTYYIAAAGYATSTGGYQVSIVTAAAPPPPTPTPTPTPPPLPGQTPTPGSAVTTQTSGTQLIIVGTNGSDNIVLSQTSSGLILTTSSGSQTLTGAYTSVVIYGFSGDDTIRVTNTVTLAGSILGGDGNDSMYVASSTSWTLNAGTGNDLMVAIRPTGGPADTLVGGAGLSSFWCGATDTISGVTSAETAAGAVHRVSQFYQPYTTDPASTQYVSMLIAGQNLTDPVSSYGTANFASTPLFVGTPNSRDIAQGAVGDCYYMASLASLAASDPDVVRQFVAPLGDGTYAVRFYSGGREVYLRLDADLPVSGSSLVFARTGTNNALWAPIMEKAYAYFRNGQNSYSSLSGGWMADVNAALTNSASSTMWGGSNSAGFYSFLQTQLSQGHAVTMGSANNASGPIVGGHAYMVQSVSTVNGVQMVTVYNPWGVDGGSSTDSNRNDGLVTLTLAQVMQYFAAAVACLR